jgi:hypothetical protein
MARSEPSSRAEALKNSPGGRLCAVSLPAGNQCSPDRKASRERRRALSSDGCMPPQIRAKFTEGERAVLSIVARQVRKSGRCELCLDAIAAQAWARAGQQRRTRSVRRNASGISNPRHGR